MRIKKILIKFWKYGHNLKMLEKILQKLWERLSKFWVRLIDRNFLSYFKKIYDNLN